MRQSKLETHLAILIVLAHWGPLKSTHIMYKADVNYRVLKDCLELLIKQGMIEKQTIKDKQTVFAVTQRGIAVLKYFRELIHALPIIEETSKQTNLLIY